MSRAPSFPTLPPVADPNMPGGSRVSRLFTNLQSLSLFLSQLLIKTDKEEEGKPVRDATVRREQDPPVCSLYSSTTPISPFRPSGFGREFHGAYCHRPGPPKPEHVRDTGGFERRSSAVRAGEREREERGAREGKGGREKEGGQGGKAPWCHSRGGWEDERGKQKVTGGA